MKDTRFIKTIRLKNLLSFGPDSEEIELRPLNVLIGPNASGKSNFIDAISILQAAPRDLSTPFSEGGGLREWIFKEMNLYDLIEIDATILFPLWTNVEFSIRHIISFDISKEYPRVYEEIIKVEESKNYYYRYQNGEAELKIRKNNSLSMNDRNTQKLDSSTGLKINQSILSQFRDNVSYPEITFLGILYQLIGIFKSWDVSRNSSVRMHQKTDLPSGFLLESYNNFSIILNDLKDRRETKDLIIEKMKLFYHEFDYIKIEIKGGTAQLFIYEKGIKDPIPATRLSDGTLRYLCLLLILCHPKPPPLICIEEPEIGLHPDIMPTIADLLIEASKRTQLIVTTHSDVLVSALSETPESVLVCEHDEAGTHLRRLEEKKLKVWLEKYSLGDLWLKGEIGGTRW